MGHKGCRNVAFPQLFCILRNIKNTFLYLYSFLQLSAAHAMVMIGSELLKGRLARVFLDLSRPDPLAEIQVPHKPSLTCIYTPYYARGN